ncbi:hypothetical protein EX227_13175 [Providencia rettgeri]|uniref:Peptidase M41 domain-containing protein n=2 Tax=Morganellaceae TaxID=1903414 RepID=A0AAP2JWB3_PRORE|nr:hypothetical protein [Providencia rettgeri]MBX6956369.1 hypothetical protein [Providencia rettgeri]MBX6958291.1 hypothetical protein [Providencia rettgeri]MBX6971294.1 hypothetical protein [Providencia rettgeri]MBX6979284.1 hypothetical protein [Providencia rettgeri]
MGPSICGRKIMIKQQIPLWVRATAFVREHLSFITLAGLFLWSFLAWPAPDTATGSTKLIVNLLDLAMPLGVVWLVITTFMRATTFDYIGYLRSLLYDIVLLGIVFHLACRFLVQVQDVINGIIDGAMHDPESAVTTVISIYISVFLYRICAAKRKAQTSIAMSGRMSVPLRQSEASLKLTAIHECGHALVYALQNTHPEFMRVVLAREARGNALRLGYMESNVVLDGRATRDQLYWRMLLALGGSAAELAVYGKQFEGSQEDMRSWSEQAERYLQNGFGNVLLLDDSKDESLRNNISAFNALHDEQVAIINQFMRDNVTLLTDMAAELRSTGSLDTPAIEAYLKRVTIGAEVPTFVITD